MFPFFSRRLLFLRADNGVACGERNSVCLVGGKKLLFTEFQRHESAHITTQTTDRARWKTCDLLFLRNIVASFLFGNYSFLSLRLRFQTYILLVMTACLVCDSTTELQSLRNKKKSGNWKIILNKIACRCLLLRFRQKKHIVIYRKNLVKWIYTMYNVNKIHSVLRKIWSDSLYI